MITDTEFDQARQFIARDPESAAYQLADLRDRYEQLRKATDAIRCLSQNLELARSGTLDQLGFVFGRTLQPTKTETTE